MQVNIRIKDELYEKLKEEAKKNYRTITSELEVLLSKALLDPKPDDNYNPIRKRTVIM